MQYEYAVKERANTINFSSAAAKRDFIREAISKEFKMDGETLLGYEDFRSKYEADNPGAIVVKKEEAPAPQEKTPKIVTDPAAKTPDEKNLFNFHFNGVRAH